MKDLEKDKKYQDYLQKLDKQLYAVEEKVGLIKQEFDETARKAKKQANKEADEVEEKVESVSKEVQARAKEQREAIQKNYHELSLYVKEKTGKNWTDMDMLQHRMKKIEHKIKQDMLNEKRKRENI